jgi:hypothetical protein
VPELSIRILLRVFRHKYYRAITEGAYGAG